MASSGILAAPVSAVRTVANASAGASTIEKSTHIGGAPGTTVTLRSRIVSSAVVGSKRCTSTAVAPTANEMPSTTLRPMMWNIGSTA